MRRLTGPQFRTFWQDRTCLTPSDMESQVKEILTSVKEKGDQALMEYTALFDGAQLSPENLQVSTDELSDAWEKVDFDLRRSLEQAAENIETFYRQGKRNSWNLRPGPQGILGEMVKPLKRVGIYIPGGRASYPSSLLMTVIPAKTAGVEEIVICTPPNPQGKIDPTLLVAAQLAGTREIFKVGGAQAVGALAYGTPSIPAVDKIFGPGNLYVTLAKKLVAGQVGIDGLAGPSEVMILADKTMPPSWAAADLLAQAEHDPDTAAILVTTEPELARAVEEEVERQLADLPRRQIVTEALTNRGALVTVSQWPEAVALVNLVAPEHLQLAVEEPWTLLGQVENAGAIFMGPLASVPLGDYAAGPSHVLPTGGTARFASYLHLEDFCKRSSLLYIDAHALSRLKETTVTLARAEGLEGHARSVLARFEPLERSEPIDQS